MGHKINELPFKDIFRNGYDIVIGLIHHHHHRRQSKFKLNILLEILWIDGQTRVWSLE